MQRKKWTPKEEVTDDLLKFREKRKWQLALRRYILEKKAAPAYAPYFGIDINGFRDWIALQFSPGLHWDNFAIAWQIDHIIPVNYFDFDNEEDLKLCWNFVNIRVEKLERNKNRSNRIDLLAVKPYFQHLYNKTGYAFLLKMVEKITQIEISNTDNYPAIENFIIQNKEQFVKMATLTREEFEKLNQGTSLKDILLEREILKKFGS